MSKEIETKLPVGQSRLVMLSFSERESRCKSLIEDEITNAANDLAKANDEVIRLKKLIGEKAAEYKLMCNHGEYLDLASRLGVNSRTILTWRKDAESGKATNSGTLYRKARISPHNK